MKQSNLIHFASITIILYLCWQIHIQLCGATVRAELPITSLLEKSTDRIFRANNTFGLQTVNKLRDYPSDYKLKCIGELYQVREHVSIYKKNRLIALVDLLILCDSIKLYREIKDEYIDEFLLKIIEHIPQNATRGINLATNQLAISLIERTFINYYLVKTAAHECGYFYGFPEIITNPLFPRVGDTVQIFVFLKRNKPSFFSIDNYLTVNGEQVTLKEQVGRLTLHRQQPWQPIEVVVRRSKNPNGFTSDWDSIPPITGKFTYYWR
jgi:hypothetical protein